MGERKDEVTFYDVILKRRNNTPNIISRVLYAVAVNHSFYESSSFSQLATEINSQIKDEIKQKVCGRVIDHMRFCFVIAEGSAQAIQKHMQKLYDAWKGQKLDQVSVLAVTDQNPNRKFQGWRSEGEGMWSVQPSRQDWNVDDQSQLPWQKYNACLTHAQSQHFERDIKLSPEDSVNIFSGRFMTMEEYFEIYLEQPHVDLFNEVMFPQPHALVKNIQYKESKQLSFI